MSNRRLFDRHRAVAALRDFFKEETAGGIVMLLSALAALIVANSALAPQYNEFVTLPVGHFTISSIVNDMLMPLFFLLVGMELKSEMTEGFLSRRGQKVLPLIAALGGIITPAIIYMTLNNGIAAHHAGWAIPTATDIAFAICVLSLVGKRVPQSAKVFLLAIAIYDDLAAILIIALFYSHGIALAPLTVGAGVVALMVGLNRHSVSTVWLYLLLGAVLWLCLHEAHIHTTVAGVITGMCIPLRAGRKTPLDTFLHQLHPPVAFFILPIFAFVSAGVSFTSLSPADLLAPLPLGIALGLFFGKQLGIFGATYAAVSLGLAPKPEGSSWRVIYGISVIAGIGFTMSLFIGFLAFPGHAMQDAVKLGVIAGSLLASLWGIIVMRRAVAH